MRIATWNTGGERWYSRTRGTRYYRALFGASPDIICLQEVPNPAAIRGYAADYTLVAAPAPGYTNSSFNHNLILTRSPARETGEISFPHMDDAGGYERVLWVDVAFGRATLRVYNCHLRIVRAGPAERLQQLRVILDHAAKHHGPAIICGDMNTAGEVAGIAQWFIPRYYHWPARANESERSVFSATANTEGFQEALPLDTPTWIVPYLRQPFMNLKLDWCLFKGLRPTHARAVTLGSDHRAIIVDAAPSGE
ncbi:MAG: endonuclease/exonuclease/phosphatase family protein [bacterium]|nr:endonuclease/exonuclease/phosphatase family protein [bacterium]